MYLEEPYTVELMLLGLPLEVLAHFAGYLELDTLGSFCQTSQKSYFVASKLRTELSIKQAISSERLASVTKNFCNLRSLSILQTGPLSASSLACLPSLTCINELIIGDISQLPDPQALFNALFKMTSLVHLEIGFGVPQCARFPSLQAEVTRNPNHQNFPPLMNADFVVNAAFSPSDLPDFDMSPLMKLKSLNTLVLRNAPVSWDSHQSLVFSCLTELETLEMTYRSPPANLEFLKPLTSLKKLTLACTHDIHGMIIYNLPVLPQLEKLHFPQWSITSGSLELQRKLTYLEFAAHKWKRGDLRVFSRMPNLTFLNMMVNWLPAQEYLTAAFPHITTLWLVGINPACVMALSGLQSLVHLIIDTPKLASNRTASGRQLAPISQLLQALPKLTGFSLVNTERIPSSLRKAILRPESQIRIVELSASQKDISKFVAVAQAVQNNIMEFVAHVGEREYTWKQGYAEFTESAPSLSNAHTLPQLLF